MVVCVLCMQELHSAGENTWSKGKNNDTTKGLENRVSFKLRNSLKFAILSAGEHFVNCLELT